MSIVHQYVVAAACALSVLLGWTANGWYRDSLELVGTKAAEHAVDLRQKREQTIASEVEDRLAQLRVIKQVIDRGVIKEIKTHETVYNNVCITESGRLRINAIAKNRPFASEPVAQVPN